MNNTVEFRDGTLHVEARGEQDENEALANVARQEELLEDHGVASAPVLIDIRDSTAFTAEARRVYRRAIGQDMYERLAFVIGSTFTRVAITFITRASGRADKTRFFRERAEALAWLES